MAGGRGVRALAGHFRSGCVVESPGPERAVSAGWSAALRTLRRLSRYLKPYRARLGLAAVALVVMTTLDVLRPVLIMLVVDRVIVGRRTDLLLPLLAAILGISIVVGAATFAVTFLQQSVGERVVRDLRNELYNHVHHLDLSFHESTNSGELISRVSTDVQAVRRFMAGGLLSTARIVMTLLATAVAGVLVSAPLTLLILLTGPGLYLTVRSFQRQIGPAFAAIHEQNAALSESLSENITGMRVVRSFGQEASEERRFDRTHEESLRRHLNVASIHARHGPLMDFWVHLDRALLLLGGGYLVISGHATIGALVAFDGYLARIMGPIREAHSIIDMIGEATTSAERSFALLDVEPCVTGPAAAAVAAVPGVAPDSGGLRLERVWLARGGRTVLEDVSLDIRPGETLAIIGRTGAGKSSLLQLLNRAYDPHRGRVLLNGRDLPDYPLDEVRRRITLIHQEAFLFSTSIEECIAYGRADATRDEIEEAARRAHAHDFITRLPRGYATVVGERGAGLSGGQRQRLTIARALVMQPAVLLVDDATSAVDGETERLIWDGLRDVMARATTVIVAQQPSTLQGVDRIAVLDEGRVIEVGGHAQLVAAGGPYARMCEREGTAYSDGTHCR